MMEPAISPLPKRLPGFRILCKEFLLNLHSYVWNNIDLSQHSLFQSLTRPGATVGGDTTRPLNLGLAVLSRTLLRGIHFYILVPTELRPRSHRLPFATT